MKIDAVQQGTGDFLFHFRTMPDYRGETAVLFLPGRFLGLEKEDAVHGEGHGQRKECRRFSPFIKAAEFSHLGRSDLGVACRAAAGETFGLNSPGGVHADFYRR